MQFNPTDKSVSIVGNIDFLLFGTSETLNADFSLADRTREINNSYDEIISEFFKADPQFMWDDTTHPDFPIATTALVAGQTHYVFPDNTLVIHRVRVKDRNGNFRTLSPKLRRELSDNELAASGDPDYYFKIDNAIFPIPVPDYSVASGVEMEFQRGANHFTTADTTREPGFDSQFHQWLVVGAAMTYALANGMKEKVSMLSQLKEAMRDRIKTHYQTRSPDERPRLRLKRHARNYGLR
jgi:hypothetical protein